MPFTQNFRYQVLFNVKNQKHCKLQYTFRNFFLTILYSMSLDRQPPTKFFLGWRTKHQVRPTGIEPVYFAWKANIRPLNYRRKNDPNETRTRNLMLRKHTPYPLGYRTIINLFWEKKDKNNSDDWFRSSDFWVTCLIQIIIWAQRDTSSPHRLQGSPSLPILCP